MKKILAILMATLIFGVCVCTSFAEDIPISEYVIMPGLGTIRNLSDNGILKASSWALEELKKADELKLIVEKIKNADMTQNITREEFAAVCVMAWEKLSGTDALIPETNPFSDCSDEYVLKAYNLAIIQGVSETEFAPEEFLTREQAATMIARLFSVFKDLDYQIGGLPHGDGPLYYNIKESARTEGNAWSAAEVFADDAQISSWAKPAVCFACLNGITNGVGDNNFAPQGTLTREQAVLLALRLVELLLA